MRPPTANHPSLLALLALLALACQSSPPPELASLPPTPNRNFSAEGAWKHLRALSEIGPRTPGSEGAAQARRYITAELTGLGLEFEEQTFMIDRAEGEPPLALTNITVSIPGASQDLFVLAAPYDTVDFEAPPRLGVDDGASGPALLLELARVLSVSPLPYSTRLLFLEGEKPTLVNFVEVENFGSKVTARQFKAHEIVPRIRLLVVFNRVAGADLRILRDRRSHRFTREAFWEAAARLGYRDAFPRSAPFESSSAGHVSFLEAGVRPAAAIVGADPAVTPSSETQETVAKDTLENCSAESLQTVGIVTLQTLDTHSQRLARIDRVSGVLVPASVPTSAAEAITATPSDAATTPSEAPETATDAALPQTAEPEPPAAESDPAPAVAPPGSGTAEIEPQGWEVEPLCASDGLSRCPRAPRAAAGASPATGVEAEAATP